MAGTQDVVIVGGGHNGLVTAAYLAGRGLKVLVIVDACHSGQLRRSAADALNRHRNPSGGGRIGWFYPWKAHYDVELGVSGQAGEWSDSGNRMWSAAVVDGASRHRIRELEFAVAQQQER